MRSPIAALLVTAVGAAAVVPTVADAQSTLLVSATATGGQGNGAVASSTSVSPEGRYVAFASSADNLVAGDTNACSDVFLRDMLTAITTRVSVAADGEQADGCSSSASVSADGRYVAFASVADNLVPGDTNGVSDAFVHDLRTGATTRVSVATDGAQADGRLAIGASPEISADGRYVAFASAADNLVPGDSNEWEDVFVHDLRTGVTTRVSLADDGTQSGYHAHQPTISADGRYVAFSTAAQLVPADENGEWDVYRRDTVAGRTELVSPMAYSHYPAISADGRYVAFQSPLDLGGGTGHPESVYVRDMAGATTLVSAGLGGGLGDGDSTAPAISPEGRYVAFSSRADDLVAGDTNGDRDIFVRDTGTGLTERADVAGDGAQANGAGDHASIGTGGAYVAFASFADNLVACTSGGFGDVFERFRGAGVGAYGGGCAPPAPPAASGPAAAPTAAPVGALRVRLGKVHAPRLRKLLAKGLPVRARCSHRCSLALTLTIDARTARRYGLAHRGRSRRRPAALLRRDRRAGAGHHRVVVGRARLELRAGRMTGARVRFTHKARRALRRARALRLRLAGVARARGLVPASAARLVKVRR